MNLLKKLLVLALLLNMSFVMAQDTKEPVKAGKFDTGKMWTFDFPPNAYLKEQYDFEPDEAWYEHVRLSALRIPGCTASFISEDGLIMTNYHCSDFHFPNYEREGENLLRDGYYAPTMEDERNVPSLWADRLEFIKDVTDEIREAEESATTDKEILEKRNAKEDELVKKYNEETGLRCEIVNMYNGGKYAIYGYRRFNDVRLVFTPEERLGMFGGDYDNFTYPRYTLDFTLYRVYDENGEPIKADHFFKWNADGPKNDDLLFTVGNPGSTNRLLTVSHLEYIRDVIYRNFSFYYNEYFKRAEAAKTQFPEKAELFENVKRAIGNSQKALNGFYQGLSNPYFIERKTDFENKFKAAVNANPELKAEYGHLWEAIKVAIAERRKHGETRAAYTMTRRAHSQFFDLAQQVIDYAEEMKKPEEERSEEYKDFDLETIINGFYNDDYDADRAMIQLGVHVDFMKLNVGMDDPYVKPFAGDLKACKAAQSIMDRSYLTSAEKLADFLEKSADEILNSDDPFIRFLLDTKDELAKLNERETEINNSLTVYNNQLGRALFEVYGTSIPPDATFTLRIGDGVMKDYDYNGTKAPLFTTFYGLFNRYYGFEKTYPWLLPDNWLNAEKDLNLSTHFDFLATFDLVGGSSGSAVINKKSEIVGIAFDGNIESLPGNFIYQPEINRAINLSTSAIIEALKKVYKADRIVEEIKEGKIVE